jgi:hypothetical protein
MMTRIGVVCVLKAANYYYIWQKMRMTNDVCFILKGRSIYTKSRRVSCDCNTAHTSVIVI